jgi:hypothetical protein
MSNYYNGSAIIWIGASNMLTHEAAIIHLTKLRNISAEAAKAAQRHNRRRRFTQRREAMAVVSYLRDVEALDFAIAELTDWWLTADPEARKAARK